MPRKKSTRGRSRGVTGVNRLMIQAERINKKIRSLEKAGLYGKYRSKELMEFVSRQPELSIKKSKGSKRHRLVVKKIRMTVQQQKYLIKHLKAFEKSKALTPTGIKNIETNVRSKVKQTLSERMEREATDEDVERLYNVFEYSGQTHQASILDLIDPSTFFYIVNTCIERNYSSDTFFTILCQYADINNDYYRREAEYLYNKFVAPYL